MLCVLQQRNILPAINMRTVTCLLRKPEIACNSSISNVKKEKKVFKYSFSPLMFFLPSEFTRHTILEEILFFNDFENIEKLLQYFSHPQDLL